MNGKRGEAGAEKVDEEEEEKTWCGGRCECSYMIYPHDTCTCNCRLAIRMHRDLEIEDYIIALNNDWQKI